MIEAGVFSEDERLELLEGVIVAMSPQSERYALVVERLSDPLFSGLPRQYVVRCQLPLALSEDAEPEPDIAVLARDAKRSAQRPPSSALLVIEVALDSLRRDREVKGAFYARAGIPEYVIVNLDADCVEVYREPLAEQGRYRTQATLGRRRRFASTSVPGFGFLVNDLLP